MLLLLSFDVGTFCCLFLMLSFFPQTQTGQSSNNFPCGGGGCSKTKNKLLSITAIEPLVRMKRLQCLCKILKMDSSRILRKVAFSQTIEGKTLRKKGRPLLSWRQAISQDIKAFHLEHIYTLSECDQIKQLSQTPLHLEIADMEWKQTVKQKKLTKNTKSKLILI